MCGRSPPPTPAQLQERVRPLRPGLSIAHPSVTAGTLGGFVRSASALAVLSNNHVLAAGDAAAVGDACLQPGPADGGGAADRVDAEPGDLPGGPLTGPVPAGPDVDPDEPVEKLGRTTGLTRGVVTAVEVDGVAVQYDGVVHRFDDQIEIQGTAGEFSAGGDSGSVIWRSRDRAPMALLFAGSSTGGAQGGGVTFANPLMTVLQTLDVVWVAQ